MCSGTGTNDACCGGAVTVGFVHSHVLSRPLNLLSFKGYVLTLLVVAIVGSVQHKPALHHAEMNAYNAFKEAKK